MVFLQARRLDPCSLDEVVIVLGSLLLDFDLRKGRVAIEITLAAMVLLGDRFLEDVAPFVDFRGLC